MSKLPLRIALRYLTSKKSHTAVNVISAISVCAVAVTAMAMVCVLSVFNGFSNLVNGNLSRLDPELRVIAAHGKAIEKADSVISIIKSVKGIHTAIPTITDNALAVYGDKQLPVTLKGVTEEYGNLTEIASLVKPDGTYLLEMQGNPLAVVSVGTAVALEAHPGYYMPLEIYAPKRKGAVNPAIPMTAFRSGNTFISGVFEVEQTEYDMNYAIVPIELARKLFDYPTQATAIEIGLENGTDAATARDNLQKALGDSYTVQDRLMQHSNSLKMINVEKWITFLLLGFILIIASFNVISTLAILIIEKNQSIYTLRSMGADNKMITDIFLTEGWLISLTGAIAGIVLGVTLCLIQQYFGIIKMNSDSGTLLIDSYPVAVEFTDVAIVLAAVALVGFLTSAVTAVAMRKRLRA